MIKNIGKKSKQHGEIQPTESDKYDEEYKKESKQYREIQTSESDKYDEEYKKESKQYGEIQTSESDKYDEEYKKKTKQYEKIQASKSDKYVKKYKKSLTIVIIICLLILAIVFIELGIRISNDKKPIYSYTASKDSNYEVLLKENDFYETETLPAGNYYVSKSVDKYLINFKYNFKSDKNKNIKYRYNITADLVGTVSNNNDLDKEIWKKTYTLLDDKDFEVNQDNFSIIENVDIDYDYYTNLAHAFEENYEISIDAILKVKLNIFYDINVDDKEREEENGKDCIELDISIADSITNIEKNYQNLTEKDIFSENETINKNQIIYFMGSGIFIIIALVLIIKIIKNKKTPEEIYRKNINYILKNYGELVVTVTNEPKLDDYIVLDVESLDDLIDLAEQNKSNIIHYEIIKNKQSNLYVILNKFAYMYSIKA